MVLLNALHQLEVIIHVLAVDLQFEAAQDPIDQDHQDQVHLLQEIDLEAAATKTNIFQ